MKKIALAVIAMMMMGTTTICAQDENPEQRTQMRRPVDRNEMVKNRTERMAKEYGLDEEQTAKLMDLNTRYADKIWQGRRGGPRMRDGQMRRGPRRDMRDTLQQAPRRNMRDTLQQGPRRDMRPERREMMPNPEEMKKNMEAYEAELKGIMTEEQFTKWKADEEKRMQEGPRQRGPREMRPTQRLQE